MSQLHFQYCPKIAVFDGDRVLVCRRKGELDYDGIYSFIGGKMEHGDGSIEAALKREKDEEVGADFRVNLLPRFSIDTYFVKKDGNHMILPHFYGAYVGGDVRLNEEYSDYAWLTVEGLQSAPNIIENMRWIAPALRSIGERQTPELFLRI